MSVEESVSVPPSIPADPPVLAGTLRLMAAIEGLPADAVGALRFGGRGVVLVQSRRVCWAVAAGMEQRLTGLLRRQRNPPLPRAFVDHLLEECRSRGGHLGEALLASGAVTEVGLRTALFRHTAEAIAHIARSGAPSDEFIPHSGAGYDARFVFSTVELFAALGARRDRALAAVATEELRRMLDGDEPGIAFVRDGGLSAPSVVTVTPRLSLRVGEALDLGRWVANLFDVCAVHDAGVRVAMGRWRDSRSVVTWRRRALLFAAPCGTAGAALLISRLGGEETGP